MQRFEHSVALAASAPVLSVLCAVRQLSLPILSTETQECTICIDLSSSCGFIVASNSSNDEALVCRVVSRLSRTGLTD